MTFLKIKDKLLDVNTNKLYISPPNVPKNLYFTTTKDYNLIFCGLLKDSININYQPIILHELAEKFIFETSLCNIIELAIIGQYGINQLSKQYDIIQTENVFIEEKNDGLIYFTNFDNKKVKIYKNKDTTVAHLFLIDSLSRLTVKDRREQKHILNKHKFPAFPLTVEQYN